VPLGTLHHVSEPAPYQSFYRRYRPQRFADVLGQEHVSLTLRNAVRSGTVAHAYLFSGPRGCGKTTSARILAKALNCTDLRDGEPCGACDSCRLVVSGASLDVTELDAASNNGVDAMRDLVARVALGTSGRRKVYIVDEVHMLSTAAANALLKTLEEPPEHVVFVLATTDPQKVLPTIKSRTQHFEFRLFPLPTLVELIRSVLADAGIELADDVVEAVARRGNGSARDALSALDQVVAAGGIDDRSSDIGALMQALAARDVAASLAAVEELMALGRDSRQVARDLQEALRGGFLATVVPGGVAGASAPAGHVEAARRLGAAGCVRGIELLGDALVAMRDALDPRVLLEVASVRISRPELDPSPAALLERLDRLERAMAAGVVLPAVEAAPTAAATTSPTAPPPASAAPADAASPPASPAASPPAPRSGPTTAAPHAPPTPPGARASVAAPSSVSGAASQARQVLADRRGTSPAGSARASGSASPGAVPASSSTPASVPTMALRAASAEQRQAPDAWTAALEAMPRMTKAMFAAARVLSLDHDAMRLAVPNEMHRARCDERRTEAEQALSAAAGRPVSIALVVDAADGAAVPVDTSEDAAAAPPGPAAAARAAVVRPAGSRPAAPPARTSAAVHDDVVDLDELVDATDAAIASTKDLMLSAFPGAQLVEEDRP
jgi:DNA polymerase-3 subunit gamma/tau